MQIRVLTLGGTLECHSLYYDATTAYVAIIFALYMMLAIENRYQISELAFGEIYCLALNELFDITWFKAFSPLLVVFILMPSDKSLLTEKELDVLLGTFIG